MRLGGNVICGIDTYGYVDCINLDGDTILTAEGPVSDVSIGGEGEIAGLDRYGELSWLDNGTSGTAPYALPDGAWDRVTISEDPWGCALSQDDHTLSCFGTDAITDLSPDASFAEVTVGEGIGCATDDRGALECWRDESACPEAGELPDALWQIQAGGCQVCGLDEDGIGRCWPRYWDQTHP